MLSSTVHRVLRRWPEPEKRSEMNISFENKVALVTGAGSGLGLATARAFAESGASVALADWLRSRWFP
jgi:FlaA1/EpsC-like NDP-sugar epimerase